MAVKRALVLSGGGARGAFQAGAIQYLRERNWRPDLVCGVSAGALNAVALGSGISPENLVSIWELYRHRRKYTFNPFSLAARLFSKTKLEFFIEPDSLARTIKKHIRFESLKNSEMDVVITAVNARTSRIAYFWKDVIEEKHLLASAAMPLLCPWIFIDGDPYWDGAIMDNAPILPALKYGADEIVAVLLSPVGVFEQKQPRSVLEASELVFEQSLAGAFNTLLADRAWPDSISAGAFHSPAPSNLHLIDGKTKLAVVAPTRMLGFKSLWDFSKKQTRRLLREGYEAARTQLSSFL